MNRSSSKKWRKSNRFLTASLIGILIPICAFAATPVYIVKAGENLSQILHRLNNAAVYGKNGTLAKVIELNDRLTKAAGDLIYPGQVIVLPEGFTPMQAKVDAPSEEPAPNDERAPASVQDDAEVQGQFSLGLGLDFFRIDATDSTTGSKSSILSNLSPSLLLGYRLQWDHELAFVVNAAFERFSLQTAKSVGFDHDSGMRSGFSIGAAYQVSSALEALLSIALQERIFFHSNSLTELAVDRLMVASPGVSLRYVVLSKPGAQVGLEGDLAYYAPTSNSYYDVHSGYHLGIGLFFNRMPVNASHGFEWGVTYVSDHQDTSLMNESEKKFLLKIIYRFND